jgi:lysophospholipase L1-like esterase
MNKLTKSALSLSLATVLIAAISVPSAMACDGKVVAFGDSNTQAANWAPNKYDNDKKWTTELAADRVVINAGIAGDTTSLALARLSSVIRHHPETVTIMLGTNDAVLRGTTARTSLSTFERHLNYMVDQLQKNGINVVLMTTVPVIEEGKGYYYSRHDRRAYAKYGGARAFQDDYNDVTRNVARKKGVALVDTYRTFLRYAGGSSDKSLVKSNLMDSSGTHMSEYGARVLHRTLSSTLDKNGY